MLLRASHCLILTYWILTSLWIGPLLSLSYRWRNWGLQLSNSPEVTQHVKSQDSNSGGPVLEIAVLMTYTLINCCRETMHNLFSDKKTNQGRKLLWSSWPIDNTAAKNPREHSQVAGGRVCLLQGQTLVLRGQWAICQGSAEMRHLWRQHAVTRDLQPVFQDLIWYVSLYYLFLYFLSFLLSLSIWKG